MESLPGTLIRERFSTDVPDLQSHAWLAVRCLAALGAFAEGTAHGEEALRIAEAVDHPNSLSMRISVSVFCTSAQGDLSRAIPVLERGLALCRVSGIPGLVPPRPPRPWAMRMPLPAVSRRPYRCWSRRSAE